MRAPVWGLVALCCLISACRCGETVKTVKPSLGVTPISLDFGPVKNGDQATLSLTLESQTQTPVAIASITLESASAPGGAEGFSLGAVPTEVASLGTATLAVTFAPTVYQAYAATLVIASNDEDRPTLRVPLLGEGGKPVITVTPDCAAARGCQGSATVNPLALDFGAEPFLRLLPIDVTKLPSITITNDGPVALQLNRVAIEGTDALAFTFDGNAMIPAGGLELEPSGGRNLALRFKPTSESQNSYQAEVVVESDDPDSPRITVALSGTLRPNLPPVVCANLVRVVPPPQGDAPRDYGQRAEWDTLLVPPALGYDFAARRDVRPGELAVFSAISDAADETACTSDPEDGRTLLVYQWRLVSVPVGAMSVAISGSATSQAQLRPVVTGEYRLELSVKDAQGHETLVPIRFEVAIKQDLVAQLQWPGFADVDLDVHLVRPSAISQPSDPFSGTFDFFSAGDAGKTSGDINGWSVTTQRNAAGAGYDFDWGQPGSADDPQLNLDDTGSGGLLENVSLNSPENDAPCATASCTYRVLVHYFRDARAGAPVGCSVDGGAGCTDGEVCTCLGSQRCVADGAPLGDAGVGAGKCYLPPQPVVRIFLKGSATPARVIPLETLSPPDDLSIGAPCQMLHVADVEWPARSAIGSLPDGGTPLATITAVGADGTGRITTPVIGRFGFRQAGGSLQCSPDQTINGVQWYARQP